MRRNYSLDDVKNCITLACEEMSSESIRKCARANRRYVNNFTTAEFQLGVN